MCGSVRNKSTPSNRAPTFSADAVRFSIVSRSMKGSEPGPLPTKPGHIALCNLGKLFIRSKWGEHGVARGSRRAPLSVPRQYDDFYFELGVIARVRRRLDLDVVATLPT